MLSSFIPFISFTYLVAFRAKTDTSFITTIFATLNIKAKAAYNKRSGNPQDCILDNWVFDNFILTNQPFGNALQVLETCVSVNDNLYGKLVPSLEFPIKFDERFRVTLLQFFIQDFNLLSCELDNFTLKVLYFVILYIYYIKAKWTDDNFTVPCEKSKTVSFYFLNNEKTSM